MKTCYTIKMPDQMHIAIADITEPGVMFDEAWYINRINVPQQYRGMGFGKALLEMICRDADEEKATLALEPLASGGLNVKQLEDWYGRHGFVNGINYMMWRYPNGTQA